MDPNVTIRIDERQKELLSSLFIQLKADNWNKLDKSEIKKLLLDLKESENSNGEKILNTLKESQIKYQYVGFLNDIILRKKLGENGFNTTTNMLNGNFGNQFIIDILLSFRTVTNGIHPRLKSLAPTKFKLFLDRLALHYDDNTIKLNKDDLENLKCVIESS